MALMKTKGKKDIKFRNWTRSSVCFLYRVMVEMAKQRGRFAGMLLFAVVTHLFAHWVKEDGFVFPKKFS